MCTDTLLFREGPYGSSIYIKLKFGSLHFWGGIGLLKQVSPQQGTLTDVKLTTLGSQVEVNLGKSSWRQEPIFILIFLTIFWKSKDRECFVVGETEHLQRPNQTNRPIFIRHMTNFLSCNSKKYPYPQKVQRLKF